MEDYKKSNRDNRDYRQGKHPDANPKGTKSKFSRKRNFKLEVSYKLNPIYLTLNHTLHEKTYKEWTKWRTCGKYFDIEDCIEGFIKSTHARILADRGSLYRIADIKTETILIDEIEIMKMKEGIKNGIWSINSYIGNEYSKRHSTII